MADHIQVMLIVLTALIGCIGGVLSLISGYVAAKLGKLTDSVESLNVKIAVVIEKLDSHDHRIKVIETKIIGE